MSNSVTAPLYRWRAALTFLNNLSASSPARVLTVQPRADGLWLSTQNKQRGILAACRFDATVDDSAADAFVSLPHAAGLATIQGLPPNAAVEAAVQNDRSLNVSIHTDDLNLTLSFSACEPAETFPLPADTSMAPIVDPTSLQWALQAARQAEADSHAKAFGFRLEPLNGRTLLITTCNYWLLPIAIDAAPPANAANLPYTCLNAFDAVFTENLPTHWQITQWNNAPTLHLQTPGATWIFRSDNRETSFPDWQAVIRDLLPDNARTTRITVDRRKLASALQAFRRPQADHNVSLIESDSELTIAWSPPQDNLPDIRRQAAACLPARVERPSGADVQDWPVNSAYLQTLLDHIDGDGVTLFMPCERSRPELPVHLQDSDARGPTAYLMMRRRG